jgi:hypothetical protein
MDDAAATSDQSYEAAQAELDRLLNDAEASFDPKRVWDLLAALTAHDVPPLPAAE